MRTVTISPEQRCRGRNAEEQGVGSRNTYRGRARTLRDECLAITSKYWPQGKKKQFHEF